MVGDKIYFVDFRDYNFSVYSEFSTVLREYFYTVQRNDFVVFAKRAIRIPTQETLRFIA